MSVDAWVRICHGTRCLTICCGVKMPLGHTTSQGDSCNLPLLAKLSFKISIGTGKGCTKKRIPKCFLRGVLYTFYQNILSNHFIKTFGYASRSSFFIMFHHFSSFFIIFHHFSSFFIIFHHFSSFFTIFHHFSSLKKSVHITPAGSG